MFVRPVGAGTHAIVEEAVEVPDLVPLRLRLRSVEEKVPPQEEVPAPPPTPDEELSTEDKLKGLLSAIKQASGSAESPQARMISEWAVVYFKKYNPTSPLPAERERAARALCFLLSNTPNPLAPAFTARLLTIITETLPHLTPHGIKKFIHIYVKKEALFLLKTLEDSLYARANRVNAALMLQFEQVKKELLVLNAERQQGAVALYERLDVVDARINQLVREMQIIHPEMGKVEQAIGSTQQALDTTLNQCDQLVNKVKG